MDQISIFDFPEWLPGAKEEPKEEKKTPAQQWAEDTGISDYWQMDEVVVFKDDRPICKYSQHSCNKKELWNVAKDLDNVFCPHVCCRKCSDKQCGARCNGADVPKQDQWNDIEVIQPEEGQFCLFEYLWTMHQKEDSKGQCTGWWKEERVSWLNMPYDIGKKRVIRWKPEEEPVEVQREPKKVNIKGLMNYGYCPDCGGCNEDLEEECRYCGCLLDWSEWKRLEGMEDE